MRKQFLGLIATLLFSASVGAVPISFTYTGSGSGSLGATAFTNAAFTINALADTDDRTSYSAGFTINHLLASIDITGIGVATFITGTRTFINDSSDVVGFSRASGADLYNSSFNAALDGWDMLSSIAIASNFGLFQWALSTVDTSLGVLAFNTQIVPGTFQATVGVAVPEPGVLIVLSLALLGFGLARRPRRQQ